MRLSHLFNVFYCIEALDEPTRVTVLFLFSDKYGLKVSDVQLPDSLEDSPYVIIKPKHYVSCVLMNSCDLILILFL